MSENFPTTRWSIVLDAGDLHPTQGRRQAGEALDHLCAVYWPPVYAYARRRGYNVEDAEDLVQGFFTRVLEKGAVRHADPARGRFRTFMLTSFRNFMANEWDRARAEKRGGGTRPISIDTTGAEGGIRLEPATGLDPETVYARQWARTVLGEALRKLGCEMEEGAGPDRSGRIQGLLTGEAGTTYREIAQDLGMTEGALKVAVHRARKRFSDGPRPRPCGSSGRRCRRRRSGGCSGHCFRRRVEADGGYGRIPNHDLGPGPSDSRAVYGGREHGAVPAQPAGRSRCRDGYCGVYARDRAL